MYVVRNVFECKPGKAGELAEKMRAAGPHLAEVGIVNRRILTDTAAGFWTVVVETEVENVADYFEALGRRSDNPALAEAMAGYMDLVTGGRREIWQLR
ncbi:MAG: hypothetical protein R2991_10355 [Thermoanaerobaculia bacterium]